MKKDFLQVLPTNTAKVYKDQQLNSADFGDYSHTDYQVFLTLISKLCGVDENGKYLQPKKLDRVHTLSAKDFSKVFHADLYNSYKYLKKAVDKLMKTDIKIETPDKIIRINVCSKAEYNKHKGSISIEFTDSVMPHLAQMKEKFILYNLKEISSFGSLYTTRLYELIQEFKETGWMSKSLLQLRKAFATGDKFQTYNNFKQRTFGRACKEINEVYNLDLSFEEIKEGRKVVAIRFTFNKTKIHKAINPKTGKPMNIYEKPKPKTKSDASNIPEVLEGQMAFDDLGDAVQGFADNLKQKRSEKF